MTNLEFLRTEKDYTQSYMAENLSITTSSYCMYEKGQRKVPKNIATEIAKILGVEKEVIFLPSTFTVSEMELVERM